LAYPATEALPSQHPADAVFALLSQTEADFVQPEADAVFAAADFEQLDDDAVFAVADFEQLDDDAVFAAADFEQLDDDAVFAAADFEQLDDDAVFAFVQLDVACAFFPSFAALSQAMALPALLKATTASAIAATNAIAAMVVLLVIGPPSQLEDQKL
jgi:hypothetical protein